MTGQTPKAGPEENAARLQAVVDRLLPIAQMYVDAFKDDQRMSLLERMRLQVIEDIISDPDGWTPERPIGPAPTGSDR